MAKFDRTKLYFGPYKTPKFKLGQHVKCAVRGPVTINKLSDSRIPWPMGRTEDNTNRMLVVYGGLEEAVRRESATAVCHWWGVTAQTVSKWRGAMGVGRYTEGNLQLRSHYMVNKPSEAVKEKKKPTKKAAAKPVKKSAVKRRTAATSASKRKKRK
ncbi:MAG: hypothetical protein QM775_32065 [Pirellulales bacterium]